MAYEFFPMFWSLALLLGVWSLILVGRFINEKSRRSENELIYRERIEAMQKGLPLPDRPPESPIAQALAQQMGLNRTAQANSIRWFRTASLALGLFFLFGGLGMLAAYSVMDGFREIWAIGLIPAMAGVGFLLFFVLSRSLDDAATKESAGA